MHRTVSNSDKELEIDQNHIRLVPNGCFISDIYAFGAFRKDLIRNIGLERTKGFLFRYGWNMGMQDGKGCKENEKYDSLAELIEYGPVIHSMKGYVVSKTTKLEVNNKNNRLKLHMEVTWENSYEAAEHLNQIGVSTCPVCYTLTGYASGFVTGATGEKTIFKEVSCRATGNKECMAIGKSQFLWGNEIKEELYYLEEIPIVEELEFTFEQLLQEREMLTTVNNIQKKLTEKIIHGNNLNDIIQEVYKFTKIPIIVHTIHGQMVANAGLTSLSLDITLNELFQNIKAEVHHKNSFTHTFQVVQNYIHSHLILISPIYLQEKLTGYCSFIFKEAEDYAPEISNMIIERVSTVSSLCLFNEKTKIDSYEWMKSFFFDEILSGQYASNDEIIAKASLIQLDLTQPFYLSLIDYTIKQEDFINGLEFRKELIDVISDYFIQKKQNFLIKQSAKHIHLLVTEIYGKNIDKESLFEALYRFLTQKFRNIDFYLGVSNRMESIQEAPFALKDALAAIRMVSENKPIIYFDTLGIVGSLINESNEKEVRMMAQALLGNIQIRNKKNVDLIQTLYSYLLNGGNLEKTAEDLSFSISGLRYRINKIEELIEKDLRSPIVRSQLLFSIQALIILGDLDLKTQIV